MSVDLTKERYADKRLGSRGYDRSIQARRTVPGERTIPSLRATDGTKSSSSSRNAARRVRFGLAPGTQAMPRAVRSTRRHDPRPSPHSALFEQVSTRTKLLERSYGGEVGRRGFRRPGLFRSVETRIRSARRSLPPLGAIRRAQITRGRSRMVRGHAFDESVGLPKRRSRSEFPTTKRLDAPIAAAAKIGWTTPKTASGTSTTL